MSDLGVVGAEVLGRFVSLFRGSLRHLSLVSAQVVDGEEWKGMLSGWAAESGRLRSLQVQELSVMGIAGAGTLVFDGIVGWAGSDGVPDEGTVEFTAREVNLREERIVGFRFACARGREGEGDAQRVLGKLAQVATVEVKKRTDWALAAAIPRHCIEERFDIGGKLKANRLVRFETPELETK